MCQAFSHGFSQFKLMLQYLQADASFYCHHIVFSSLGKQFSVLVPCSSFQVADVKKRVIVQHTPYTPMLWEFNFFLSQCKFPVTSNKLQTMFCLSSDAARSSRMIFENTETRRACKTYRLTVTKSGSKSYSCSLCK